MARNIKKKMDAKAVSRAAGQGNQGNVVVPNANNTNNSSSSGGCC